jgi:hypothetical protein
VIKRAIANYFARVLVVPLSRRWMMDARCASDSPLGLQQCGAQGED